MWQNKATANLYTNDKELTIFHDTSILHVCAIRQWQFFSQVGSSKSDEEPVWVILTVSSPEIKHSFFQEDSKSILKCRSLWAPAGSMTSEVSDSHVRSTLSLEPYPQTKVPEQGVWPKPSWARDTGSDGGVFTSAAGSASLQTHICYCSKRELRVTQLTKQAPPLNDQSKGGSFLLYLLKPTRDFSKTFKMRT